MPTGSTNSSSVSSDHGPIPDKPTYPDHRRCPGCGIPIDWDRQSVTVRGDLPVLVLLVEVHGGYLLEVHRCRYVKVSTADVDRGRSVVARPDVIGSASAGKGSGSAWVAEDGEQTVESDDAYLDE